LDFGTKTVYSKHAYVMICEVHSSLCGWKSYLGLHSCRVVRRVAKQLFPDVQRRRDMSKRQSVATHSAETRRLAEEAG
jgi:hypothetical protein